MQQDSEDIHGDGLSVKEQDAKILVDNMRKAVLKETLQILSLHCPQVHCKNSTSKRDLIDWLKSTNARRDYIFYSNNGLKALIRKKILS